MSPFPHTSFWPCAELNTHRDKCVFLTVVTGLIIGIPTVEYDKFHGLPFRCSWTAGSLKMGSIHGPETSVTKYQSTLRNIPEELRSQR
jgi:hypothetical protein